MAKNDEQSGRALQGCVSQLLLNLPLLPLLLLVLLAKKDHSSLARMSLVMLAAATEVTTAEKRKTPQIDAVVGLSIRST